MFINEEYKNYKYIVEENDNFITLTRYNYVDGTWEQPEKIDVIHQYIKPSTLVIEDEMTFTNTREFQEVDVSTNYWDRGDACEITLTTFSIIWFILFVINALTRLVRKGGVFFGQ